MEYITRTTISTLLTLQQRDGAGGPDRRQETSTLLGLFPQRDLLRLFPLLQEHQVSEQQGQLQERSLQGQQLLQLC